MLEKRNTHKLDNCRKKATKRESCGLTECGLTEYYFMLQQAACVCTCCGAALLERKPDTTPWKIPGRAGIKQQGNWSHFTSDVTCSPVLKHKCALHLNPHMSYSIYPKNSLHYHGLTLQLHEGLTLRGLSLPVHKWVRLKQIQASVSF